ncbi:2-isopropylmalate synthase [Lacticaseibacillus porcinae]|uniref:2-isopropylmalate synthase n=1 Tax=Lacticaseibacillus porcinae TaxID=1123687 RepID=UPI000F78C1EB|nr:2-isopropylmalate synthase [Lacticaseibacillus porcinae]
MTKQIKFFDTTLRDGEQTIGVNFSVAQKVEIAKALEAWGVDYIEAGFPIASPEDFRAVNAIAKTIKHTTVTGLARLVRKDMIAVRDAIAPAPHQMLHTFIATSPIHREYKLHMTKEEMIAKIRSDVAYAKTMFDVVEFSPEDASRTEPDFLVEAVQAAIDAGATMINIPDTVGYDDPEEFGAIFANLKAHIAEFDQIEWAAHTHNDLGMAMANAMAAIKNGATQVQGTINGLGDRAGNVDEIQVAAAIHVRGDFYNAQTNINLPQTKHVSEIVAQASSIAVGPNRPIVGANAFAHESGIHQDGMLKNRQTYEILVPEDVGMHTSLPLGKLSGSHAVMNKLNEMGYQVNREMMTDIFPMFKAIADETDLVTPDEMIAMMQDYKTQQQKRA